MEYIVGFIVIPVIIFVIAVFIMQGRRKKKEQEPKIKLNENVIFDVSTFNSWFQDPDNRAIYANAGIFLRTDKLSESQIYDYLAKMFGVVNVDAFDWDTDPYILVHNFYDDIRNDWKNKLKEISMLSEKY